VEERARRRLAVERKKVELAAETAVVTALELFETRKVGIELLLRRKGRAVDTLQHLVALIAPEVGARSLEQPDGADLRGALDVGSPAQIEERAV